METYQVNSCMLDSWAWRCVLYERTCIACLVMNGQEFSVDSPFNPLHGGYRCVAEPILTEDSPSWGETGRE